MIKKSGILAPYSYSLMVVAYRTERDRKICFRARAGPEKMSSGPDPGLTEGFLPGPGRARA